MGAVTFSIDPKLVDCLRGALPLRVFVETGTFEGDTVHQVLGDFETIHTVEMADDYFEQARSRFAGLPQVTVHHGSSSTCLASLASALRARSVLYWLDAHWCNASGTAGWESQCPLLQELQAIGTLNQESVILIDDARLFLAPPPDMHDMTQWPRLHQIVLELLKLSPAHELCVFNDVIMFYPTAIRERVEKHTAKHSYDWLKAVHLSRAHDEMRQTFGTLRQTCDALRAQLATKEDVIRQQTAVLNSHALKRLKNWMVRPLHWTVRPLHSLVGWTWHWAVEPRLGMMRQYPPRPVALPDYYHQERAPEDAPVISIVTPSYNHADFLERTLQSVLSQGYPRLQYIVQDGGSTDRTGDVLEKYRAQLVHCVSVRDKGQADAINRGFRHATGEILAYLNSDDVLLPGCLAYVARFFAANPDVDVVYGHRLIINEHDQETGRWIMPPHDAWVLHWADYVPQETLFWRRRIWEKTGAALDESFHFALDWDLLLRFQEAGAKFVRLPRFLAAFRTHSQQKTTAQIGDLGQREMSVVRERWLGRRVSADEVHRHIRPFLRKHVVYDRLYRMGLIHY